MSTAKRPESDTPEMAQRRFSDEDGRLWVGSVRSGTLPGGEEHAQVIFLCEDEPGELKRVARLEAAPAAADEAWTEMNEDEVRAVFRGSEPA